MPVKALLSSFHTFQNLSQNSPWLLTSWCSKIAISQVTLNLKSTLLTFVQSTLLFLLVTSSNRGVSISLLSSAIWRYSSRLLNQCRLGRLSDLFRSPPPTVRERGSPRGDLLHRPAAIETHKFVKICPLAQLRKPTRGETPSFMTEGGETTPFQLETLHVSQFRT